MSNSKAFGFFAKFCQLHAQLVSAAATIDYNHRWANGTGYLDGAVSPVHLEDGQVLASTDGADRRIILVGSPIGNLVIFERYKANEDTQILVSNQPKAMASLLPGCDTSWTEATWAGAFPDMAWSKPTDDLTIDVADNVGHAVAAIGRAIQARSNWVNNPNKKS